MPSVSFNDEQLQRHAEDMGFVAEGETVPTRLRSKVAASLLQHTSSTSEPLTVRVEITYRGAIIGANTIQIPHPGAAT